MIPKVGVITTFYGFNGDLIQKVENLVKIFDSINIQPYIQLNCGLQKQSFDEIAKKLNNIKKEYDVIYSVHQSMFLPDGCFYLNLGSSDDVVWIETINSLKKSIDLAKEIGSTFVSFHGGYAANRAYQKVEMSPVTIDGKISFQEAYSNFRRGLNKILNYAEGDVDISVENCCYRPLIRNLFSRSEDFRYLSDRAKILFDVGHAYFSKKTLNDNRYTDRIIEERRISEIHISDNDGSKDAHQLIGYGTIPFEEVFKHLIRIQRLPPVIIEATQKRWKYTDNDLGSCITNLTNMLSNVSKWEYKDRIGW